ncbi:MAG: hypothetical protein N2067_02085 [Spirochaetaceae bacterium]|nr:hypothetical protein [Spirochaetaceae bacterium]
MRLADLWKVPVMLMLFALVAAGSGVASAQDTCGIPSQEGGTVSTPAPLLMLPASTAGQAASLEPASLWTLEIVSLQWSYDPGSATCALKVLLRNNGAERVRGAGIELRVLDGAGRLLAGHWKVTEHVYLEAGESAEINLQLALPAGSMPAAVIVEAVQVMGSCGW